MSFARLVLSTSSLEEMPFSTPSMLPPRYAIIPLVQHFLDNIYVLYPFLSETKLFASIDVLYLENGRHASSTDHWTVRLVLAIALASLSRRRGDAQYEEAIGHAVAALAWAERVLQPGSVIGIQAILLLVLYAMLDHRHFNSWYLIGVASRAMVDLGLHQESAEASQLKTAEAQTRRRVYHSVYILDRSIQRIKFNQRFVRLTLNRTISIAHLRAFSFTDDSANVAFLNSQSPFPSISAGSDEQEQLFLRSLDPAVQLLRLCQIQSAAYQTLFKSSRTKLQEPWQVMNSHLHEMHLWVTKIPNTIRQPMKKLFRSKFLYDSILVLTPPGLTCNPNAYGRALLFSYAIEYAEIMSSISGDLEKFAFYNSHDLLRASQIAERFLTVLKEQPSRLLDQGMPEAPPSSYGIPPPLPLPNWGLDELLSKAATCLSNLEKALGFLGTRYDNSEPLRLYRLNSQGVMQMLNSRREQQNQTTR